MTSFKKEMVCIYSPTPEQKEFIEACLTGDVLLVAGPGTGKSRTLAETARRLVDEGNASPEDIAVVTLTRSLAGKLEVDIPHGQASTFHSLCLNLLNQLGLAAGMRVVDPWEEEHLVIRDLQLIVEDSYGTRPNVKAVKQFLRRLAKSFRSQQTEPQDLSTNEKQLLSALTTHRKLLRYRLLDQMSWDLDRALRLSDIFIDLPTVLLVDEYQDLTAGELRLIQTLHEKHDVRVIACGDDRQCIFGFRDADPLGLPAFSSVYGIKKPHWLSASFRCPERVCHLAEEVAEILPNQFAEKRPTLHPHTSRSDEGAVEIHCAKSPQAEADYVLNTARELVAMNVVEPWQIMVVISKYQREIRTQLQASYENMENPGFVLNDPSTRSSIVNTDELRLLSTGVRLLLDSKDQLAWRTLAALTPGLGDMRVLQLLTTGKDTLVQNTQLAASSASVVKRVLDAGEGFLSEFAGSDLLCAEEAIHTLAEMIGLAPDVNVVETIIGELGAKEHPFAWQDLIREMDSPPQIEPEDMPEAIQVRTIHSAKGLQSEVVFLMNAIEQSFDGDGDPADGIRRLYVGLTRARSQLYVSTPGWVKYHSLGHTLGCTSTSLHPQLEIAAQTCGIEIQTN